MRSKQDKPQGATDPDRSAADGAQQISELSVRSRATVRGQVLGTRIRPSDTLPTFVVRLGDDSGSLTLIWTGRRRVGGVSLGRTLVAEGTVVASPDGPCMYNPVYSLEP